MLSPKHTPKWIPAFSIASERHMGCVVPTLRENATRIYIMNDTAVYFLPITLCFV